MIKKSEIKGKRGRDEAIGREQRERARVCANRDPEIRIKTCGEKIFSPQVFGMDIFVRTEGFFENRCAFIRCRIIFYILF